MNLSDELQVVKLLSTTKLSSTVIGKQFNVTSSTISIVKKKYKIERANIRIKKLTICSCGNILITRNRVKGRENRGKYCSRVCYNNWQRSPANHGSNHPAWIDGGKHESELQKLRRSEEWKVWRKAVYQRDRFTCQKCNQVGGHLHPHHVLPKAKFPDKIFDVNNGLTLCRNCHMTVHGRNKKTCEAQLMAIPYMR